MDHAIRLPVTVRKEHTVVLPAEVPLEDAPAITSQINHQMTSN